MRRFAEDRRWTEDKNRCREVPGGGGKDGIRKEYHYTLFPPEVINQIVADAMIAEVASEERDERSELISESLWHRFQSAPGTSREEADRRLKVVQHFTKLRQTMPEGAARALVEAKTKTPIRTLYRWLEGLHGLHKSDWLPALLPEYKGRTSTAPCHQAAWDMLVSDYLRNAGPSFASCYARMEEAAKAHEWAPIPSKVTLKRRLDAEFGPVAIKLAREGKSAAAQLYPAQTRDRSVFHAMEAVNADGHVFDVFVKFDDGSIGRPCLIGFQDIYSGMVLSFRISQTENKETTRLAISDMVDSWGIPDHVYFDNGRAFMSKWITGGMKHRFRFKVKDEEPKGVLTQLNVEVHNTTPYHGQAKPIERAWRDMVDRISRHPALEGAFTGNTIDAKPENYGSRAIPIDEFRKFVAQEIMRHNTRKDRNTQTAKGRSFAEVFQESLERPGVVVRRASPLQRQFLLLAGEGKTARRTNGEIHLAGNRYWSEHLIAHAGRKLMVRFDPEDLHGDIFVYTMDGRFIDRVECIEAVGFNDAEAARQHAKTRRQFMKAHREVLRLGRLLTPAQVAAQIPDPEPLDMELPKVVGLQNTPSAGLAPPTDTSDAFGRGLAASLGVSNIFDHPNNQSKGDGTP
ncbi:transposase domain-containing protein [Cognatishimia sp. MH4019]|uniref:transposase domain-containing protein n=1 Tax=Cognatishimia sp. MH4019 TaxID=2854030 RepID=UPI001CD50A57|nr:transposase domain-containing protein [Cognatishimia sp. MH4019]